MPKGWKLNSATAEDASVRVEVENEGAVVALDVLADESRDVDVTLSFLK